MSYNYKKDFEEPLKRLLVKRVSRPLKEHLEIGDNKMQDSKGNYIEVGDKLGSSQNIAHTPDIECISISGESARFKSIKNGVEFDLSNNNLRNSFWIKIKACGAVKGVMESDKQ